MKMFGIIIFFALVGWVFKIVVTRCRSFGVWDKSGLQARTYNQIIFSDCGNVNSHSGIYDESGNRKLSIKYWRKDFDEHYMLVQCMHWVRIGSVRCGFVILFSVRSGLALVQGEWNILRMGNPAYVGQCKLVRFKTIYIESLDVGGSVPLMTNGVVNVSKISNLILKRYDLTKYLSKTWTQWLIMSVQSWRPTALFHMTLYSSMALEWSIQQMAQSKQKWRSKMD